MIPFEVRTLPIADLRPAPYNPRQILKPSDPAYRTLKASLERFGLVEPLVWNERTGHIVDGHARLRILRELGHETVPVSVVRLGDAEEKALNVVLNNHEAQGRFDRQPLRDLLRELHDLPEFALTGFDPSILRQLDYEPARDTPAEADPDRVEITVVTDRPTFETLKPGLDQLVRDYDLTVHVTGATW